MFADYGFKIFEISQNYKYISFLFASTKVILCIKNEYKMEPINDLEQEAIENHILSMIYLSAIRYCEISKSVFSWNT